MYWRGSRVVEQHVAHALGLRVLDQLVRVAGGGERGVLPVLRAQHAIARARGHLAAREGLGKALGRGVGAGLYGHGLQHGVGATGLGHQGLLAAQAENGQGNRAYGGHEDGIENDLQNPLAYQPP
jgi:hypothetical protein